MNPQNGSSSSSAQHSHSSQAHNQQQFNMNQQQSNSFFENLNRQMGRNAVFPGMQPQQPQQQQQQQQHEQSPRHNEESSILSNMAIEHLMPTGGNHMQQHNFAQRAGPVPHVIQNKPNDPQPQQNAGNVKYEEQVVGGEDDEEPTASPQGESSVSPAPKKRGKRRKIEIKFIESKAKRRTTFHKRKEGLLKKAYELSTLTGSEALLLIASETGQVYTFATKKFQSLIVESPGKDLIERCLNQPDDSFGE